MEKDVDRFEKLLKQHSYESLSCDEKEWVRQFVTTPEEYEAMRSASQALEAHYAAVPLREALEGSIVTEPDPAILVSLQKRLLERNMSSRWSVPAWAAMLALVVAGGAGWYAGSSAGVREVYVDRLVTKTDTLRVASKPDTVVIERVVYRHLPTVIPATVVNQKPSEPTPPAKGINMKEKAELEKLLVSGGL